MSARLTAGKNAGPRARSRLVSFVRALTRAEQEAVQSLVVQIRDAAKFDWRAAAFLLERKHKKDWGRHESVDMTVNDQRAADIERRLLKGRELNAQVSRELKAKQRIG